MHIAALRPLQKERVLHEVLLKAVREVTGKDATFIRWNLTGPARQGPEHPAEEPHSNVRNGRRA